MAQANPTALADFSGFINPDRAQAYFEEARKRSVVQQPAAPRGIWRTSCWTTERLRASSKYA